MHVRQYQKRPPIPITAITGKRFIALESETSVIAVISTSQDIPAHVDNFSVDDTICPIVENAKV